MRLRCRRLPAVVGELDEVVSDAQDKGAQGVLPGTILLNGAFTEKAMENLLSSPHTVVHIASHFVFQPGDDSQSYLLLAGKDQDASGYHLTVADFRDDQKLSSGRYRSAHPLGVRDGDERQLQETAAKWTAWARRRN